MNNDKKKFRWLVWEHLNTNGPEAQRTKVPGGWFVRLSVSERRGIGIGGFFYPDPDHSWDGTSLE